MSRDRLVRWLADSGIEFQENESFLIKAVVDSAAMLIDTVRLEAFEEAGTAILEHERKHYAANSLDDPPTASAYVGAIRALVKVAP